MKSFNNDRTFGVEIEFVGDADRVAEILTGLGETCKVERYNKVTKRFWKVVRDGSVSANRNQTGGGWELVSPILKGQRGLQRLETACKALERAGAEVNITCGLHVHHGADGLDVQGFKNVVALYYRFEGTLDSLMPKSRRGNHNTYCKSVRKFFSYRDLETLDNISEIDDLLDYYADRFYKLNLSSYRSHSTVEFRHHSGTIEFEKIANWIRLTQGIMERAALNKRVHFKPKGRVKDTWTTFKDAIFNCAGDTKPNEYKNEILKFYRNRQKQLAA